MPLIDSGERKAEFGKITKVMKCINEHEITVPLNPRKSEKNNLNKTSCSCPVCGWFGHLTEHPDVRKCGNGHEFECK